MSASKAGGTVKLTQNAYNVRGRLATVLVDSGGNPGFETTVQYKYNDSGIRVSQTANGTLTRFHVDANNHTGYAQVLEELDTFGAAVRSYLLGHDVLSQFDSTNGNLWLLYDGHGSTRGLVDALGQPLSSEVYAYDGYGNLLGFAGTPKTVLLYSGEWRDLATGLDYLRYRPYSFSTGRFLQLDPFAGDVFDPLSLHKYLYTHGDPINGADPLGLASLTEVGSVGVTTSLLRSLQSSATFGALVHSQNAIAAAAIGSAEATILAALSAYKTGELVDILVDIIGRRQRRSGDHCARTLGLPPNIGAKWTRQRAPIDGHITVQAAAFRLDAGAPVVAGPGTTGTSRQWVGEIGKPSDVAGHVIARRFGGSNQHNHADGNIIPQHREFNNSFMRRAEDNVARLHDQGHDVCALVIPFYRSPADLRPYLILYAHMSRPPGGRFAWGTAEIIDNP